MAHAWTSILIRSIAYSTDVCYDAIRFWADFSLGRAHLSAWWNLWIALLRAYEGAGRAFHLESSDSDARVIDAKPARRSASQIACLLEWAPRRMSSWAPVQQQADERILLPKLCHGGEPILRWHYIRYGQVSQACFSIQQEALLGDNEPNAAWPKWKRRFRRVFDDRLRCKRRHHANLRRLKHELIRNFCQALGAEVVCHRPRRPIVCPGHHTC